MTTLDPSQRRTVTVCNACLRACCWQGFFMCDKARDAGTVKKTIAELRALVAGEHSDYWAEGRQ